MSPLGAPGAAQIRPELKTEGAGLEGRKLFFQDFEGAPRLVACHFVLDNDMSFKFLPVLGVSTRAPSARQVMPYPVEAGRLERIHDAAAHKSEAGHVLSKLLAPATISKSASICSRLPEGKL